MKKSIDTLNLLPIGFISKPSGFKGELLVAVENGDAEDYAAAKFFFIELEGKPVPFYAEQIKTNGESMVVKLEDVNTEAEARALSAKKVFVEGDHAFPDEQEIDWSSLVGFEVADRAYGKLGTLESIEEYPQQIIGKCTVNGKEVLFPLNEDFILEIDTEKKELKLNLPEGLLDVYLK